MTVRVLIFGASGFLGRRLFLGFPELEVFGTAFRHAADGFMVVDLRDTAAAVSLVETAAPDVIIYAAALADTAGCERDHDAARLINTVTPKAIASAASCPMLYISTDYVFDGSQVWYREYSPAKPASYYGKTKLAGERGILSADDRNTVLRVSGLFDADATARQQHSAATSGRVDLISTPLHVDDAVSGVRIILKNSVRGILHAGGPDRMTRYDLLQLSRLHFCDAPDIVPTRGGDDYSRPDCSTLVCDRLRAMGWTARRPATVFAPAILDDEDLHIRALSTPKKEILVLDCIGALLTARGEPLNQSLDEVDHACAQVADEEQFWNTAIAQTGEPDIIDRISDRYVINPGLWRHVIALRRQGYRLVAANNGPSATFSRWRTRLGLDAWFHDTVNSVEVRLDKSMPAFFNALATRMKCPTSDLVLLDDSHEVCHAAHAAGVQTILTKHCRIGALEAYTVDDRQSEVSYFRVLNSSVQSLSTCEPDARFFRQLRLHATLLRSPKRNQYFMLSAGTNLLPAWEAWSKLATIELDTQLAYAWYTSQTGFPLLSHAAALYENSIAAGRFLPDRSLLGRSAAMTFGASQAVALVFDYLAETFSGASLLVVEPCYPLVFRQAAQSGLKVVSVTAKDASTQSMLPPACDVVAQINSQMPTAVILSTPANPSGETYIASDIQKIGETCALNGTLLVIDRAGELVTDLPITRALGDLPSLRDGTLQCVVINSLSKSEALAGYRIGYVVGPTSLIETVAARQLFVGMNPPTVPALPVFLVLLLRCALLNQEKDAHDELAKFARRMFRATTAIAPRSTICAVEKLLDQEWQSLRQSYHRHHIRVGETIATNEAVIREQFGEQILTSSRRSAGLNIAVLLARSIGRAEDDFCREVLEKSGVALLSESCFRSSTPSRPWYWTRVSLAAPIDEFNAAFKRLIRAINE